MQLQEQFDEPEINEAANVTDAGNAGPVSIDNAFEIHVRIVDQFSDYAVLGVLLGFIPGEVTILVNEPLSENREVTVYMSAFSFEGQTLYCRPNETRYEVHISIDDIQGAGLRRTPRFPVMIPAELLSPSHEPVAITIRDLSRDGMGIESPILLKAGQPIAIVSGPAFVFAVVRHCQPLPSGLFRAGVEMHHLFEKPPQPPIEPPQPSLPGKLLKRWTAKLLWVRARSRSGSRHEVRRLGGSEVES